MILMFTETYSILKYTLTYLIQVIRLGLLRKPGSTRITNYHWQTMFFMITTAVSAALRHSFAIVMRYNQMNFIFNGTISTAIF